MITLPEHVTSSDESGGWNGYDDSIQHDNLESDMPWTEHQRIVCKARELLGASGVSISGPGFNSDARKAFQNLKSAYADAGSKSELRVSKGIHQRNVDPHLQLRLTTDYGKNQVALNKFHLEVYGIEVKGISAIENRFTWQPARFSVVIGKKTYYWPTHPVGKTLKRQRRMSMTAADLQKHIVAAEAEAKILALKNYAQAQGITKQDVNKFLKGYSVKGTDGTYRYGKPDPEIVYFKSAGNNYSKAASQPKM